MHIYTHKYKIILHYYSCQSIQALLAGPFTRLIIIYVESQ